MDGAALAEVLAEYARLEEGLADPRMLRDFRRARRVRRSLEALASLRDSAVRLLALREDSAAARELAAGDRGWAAEAERLAAACARAEARLAAELAGRDRYDPYDVIVTIEGDAQDVGLGGSTSPARGRRTRRPRCASPTSRPAPPSPVWRPMRTGRTGTLGGRPSPGAWRGR